MQKVYFKWNYYIYVAKAHPSDPNVFFLFAKSTTGESDYFLGRLVGNEIQEVENFRSFPWHIQKGAERLFVILIQYGRPTFDSFNPLASIHTAMFVQPHRTNPKPERNKEIVLRRKKNPKLSYRRLGEIYNLHWTTVESIIKRYTPNPKKMGPKVRKMGVGKLSTV